MSAANTEDGHYVRAAAAATVAEAVGCQAGTHRCRPPQPAGGGSAPPPRRGGTRPCSLPKNTVWSISEPVPPITPSNNAACGGVATAVGATTTAASARGGVTDAAAAAAAAACRRRRRRPCSSRYAAAARRARAHVARGGGRRLSWPAPLRNRPSPPARPTPQVGGRAGGARGCASRPAAGGMAARRGRRRRHAAAPPARRGHARRWRGGRRGGAPAPRGTGGGGAPAAAPPWGPPRRRAGGGAPRCRRARRITGGAARADAPRGNLCGCRPAGGRPLHRRPVSAAPARPRRALWGCGGRACRRRARRRHRRCSRPFVVGAEQHMYLRGSPTAQPHPWADKPGHRRGRGAPQGYGRVAPVDARWSLLIAGRPDKTGCTIYSSLGVLS